MQNGSLLEVCGVSEVFLRDSGPEPQVKLGERRLLSCPAGCRDGWECMVS